MKTEKRKFLCIEIATTEGNQKKLKHKVARALIDAGMTVFQAHINDVGGYESYVPPDEDLAKGAAVT